MLPEMFVIQKSDRVIKMFIFAESLKINQVVKKDFPFLVIDEYEMIDALVKHLKNSGKFEELLNDFFKTSYTRGENWIVSNPITKGKRK